MSDGPPIPSQEVYGPRYLSCLAYSPSGARIIGGTGFGELYVFDASSGSIVLGPLKGHSEEFDINHICFFSEEVFVSASTDGTVRQWNCRTGEPIGKPFTGHDDSVLEAACLVNKKTIGSFARHGQVLTWHMDTLEVLGEFRVRMSVNQPATFSHDGTRLVATSLYSMAIYDMENCQQLIEVDLHSRGVFVHTAAYAPDLKSIYFYCGGPMVVWNVEKEEFEDEVFVGSDWIAWVTRCSPDGKLVATSDEDDKTYVWSTASREVIKIFDNGGPFAFSPDGHYFTHPGREGELAINDVRQYLPVEELPWLDHPVTNQVVEVEEEQEDQQTDLFHTERKEPEVVSEPPVQKTEDNPLSPGSELKKRGPGLMSRLFRRRKRSQSAQENDQVSVELVYTARDKRPLIVASRESDVQDRALDRRDSTWTVTSTSPSVADEADAQAIDGEHYGCCYVCCFKLC
ncbi:hypothetical protein EDD15DRAFT_2244425 [Pisolithus albus]|nr:hypothetical protein EDD15DRAFT_2244425 [Pisolithus albus]